MFQKILKLRESNPFKKCKNKKFKNNKNIKINKK